MAPSILLEPDSPRLSYSHPASKAEGGVSLEAHAPVGGKYALNGASSGDNHVTDGNGFTGNDGRASRQRNANNFVTSQSLLQQSQNYGTQNQASGGSQKKPNILYIMADQMAAPLLKMNDPNSVIKTPHLDKLAKTGVNFASAYCNSPLCAPSRFTMCTGQLPSKIGGYDNASILGPEVPTYAHYLRREGYETALAGKMHFIGPDQLHGFEHR
jgi:phosphoglycerol transferase MdoB-like AlkP superfamily enzyme